MRHWIPLFFLRTGRSPLQKNQVWIYSSILKNIILTNSYPFHLKFQKIINENNRYKKLLKKSTLICMQSKTGLLKITTIITALLFWSLQSFSQQPSKSDLEKQRASIQQEIEDVKRELDETKRNRKETLGQLSLLQRKLRLREAAIQNINQQINYIQGDMNQSSREIISLRKELDTLRIQYEESVVYAYKNRSNYDFLNFIFSAISFNDAVKRIEYLKTYR